MFAVETKFFVENLYGPTIGLNYRMLIKKYLSFLLGVYTMIFAITSHGYNFTPTKYQWETWPRYCQARYTQLFPARLKALQARPVPTKEIGRWKKRIGGTFGHVHHACRGFLLNKKARTSFDEEKKRILTTAAHELNYTYREMPKEHSPLLAKISGELADAMYGLGREREAIRILDDAIRYQPNNIEVYKVRANHFRKKKQYLKALEALKYGARRLKKKDKKLFALISFTALQAKDYKSAQEYARYAYEAGYKSEKLKKKLEKAGHPLR